MLLSIEKVLFLKSAPLFAAIEGEELAALADIALEHAFQPGEIIFEENQAPHHLYVLVQGKVEVFRRVDSKERSLAYLGEKECFGEMAILDDQPRSASVRAAEPTTVLKIDRESFRELILERPHIAFAGASATRTWRPITSPPSTVEASTREQSRIQESGVRIRNEAEGRRAPVPS
jgi:CRP-like cAMP-binding protein